MKLLILPLSVTLVLATLVGCGREFTEETPCAVGCNEPTVEPTVEPPVEASDAGATPSCQDGVANQGESDVDCGGNSGCARCALGSRCSSNADCELAQCWNGICQAPTCSDGIRNGDESDTDCGGATCPGCVMGKACAQAGDCLSQVCVVATGMCGVPSCGDGVKNGNEPSVDCGGDCELQCPLGAACSAADDCESGTCNDHECAPQAPTGVLIDSTGWTASASDTYVETVPGNALDNDPESSWASGASQIPGMWFLVDMAEPRTFFTIRIQTAADTFDYARRLRVTASLDGADFSQLCTDVTGESELQITFPSVQYARYLKLELLEDSGGQWWQIHDFQVLQ